MYVVQQLSDGRKRPESLLELFGGDPIEKIADEIARAIERGADLRPLLDKAVRLVTPVPRGCR